MHRSHIVTRLALLTSLALVAFAAPAWAIPAPPTGSQITEPTDPAFVVANSLNPGTLHIAGTISGGSGPVDILCYANTGYVPIATGVAPSSGSFTVDVSLTQTLLNSVSYSHGFCVLRAVPAGTHPAAAPDQLSPFQGPHIGWGRDRSTLLGAGGAPNPADQVWDAYISQAQSRAFDDYLSVGSCGLCDTYLYDPATFKASSVIWWANDALYSTISYDTYNRRSEVQIDGVDAYAPGAIKTDLRNNPGMPVFTHSTSVDPLTGDLTIDESDPFVSCSPQPATYPASDATCPAFAAAKVTLDRTIIQSHDGRQVTITDHWHSDDAQPHQLDALYDDSAASEHHTTAGHSSVYDFSWSASSGFKTYADNTEITPPASGPATLYVKSDGTTPDVGDGQNPIGALTYATPPCALHIQRFPSTTGNSTGDWQARYMRTIPASGDLVITQVYSHDYSLASVQALAQEAKLSLPQVSTTPAPCPMPVDPGPTPDPAPADTPTDTTPAQAGGTDPQTVPTSPSGVPTGSPVATPTPKCHVPKLRGKTLSSAKRMLRQAHCNLGHVTRRSAASVRPGRVIGTNPRPGTTRTAGARISVRVARASA
jgi:hypothetical protein